MMRSILRLSLAVILTISSASTSLAANKCEDLFGEDLKTLFRTELTELVSSHYSIEKRQSLIGDLFLKMAVRQYKLKDLSTPRNIRRSVYESEHMLEVAAKFAKDFNSDHPPAEVAWLRREVLSRGVESLVQQYRYTPEKGKTIGMLLKIFKSRAVQFALNFRKLPYRQDKVLSEELYAKILQDGPEAHKQELIAAYKEAGQNGIDNYRRVSKIYSTFFILLLAYTTWNQLSEVDDKINKAEYENTLESLDELNQMLEVLDQELSRRGLYKELL